VCSTSAFFLLLVWAQKGAEDQGQIKAQLGGMPVRLILVMKFQLLSFSQVSFVSFFPYLLVFLTSY